MSLKYETVRMIGLIDYRRHGEIHRVHGPAEIWENTSKFWMQHGMRHRLDGPSDLFCGISSYNIHGKEYTKEQYESKIRSLS